MGLARWRATRIGVLIVLLVAPSQVRAAPSAVLTATGPKPVVSEAAKPTHALASSAQKAPKPVDEQAVISYLSKVISWYGHLPVEQRVATAPEDMLLLANDQQMAGEVLQLAFQYARAQAALLLNAEPQAPAQTGGQVGAAKAPGPASPMPATAGGTEELQARLAEAQTKLKAAQDKVAQLRDALQRADVGSRQALSSELATARQEVELQQARINSMQAMVDFEATQLKRGGMEVGLLNRIAELERSVAQPGPAQQPPAPGADAAASEADRLAGYSGIVGRAESLLYLQGKQQALESTAAMTRDLLDANSALGQPLTALLDRLNRRADQLASESGTGDLASTRQRKLEFDGIIAAHKMAVEALMPLSKQAVVLRLYIANLDQWREATVRRQAQEFRGLLLRLIALGALLGLVFAGALVWRQLTFRYVQDVRHRHRLLQVRRYVVIVLLLLIVVLDFSSELNAVLWVAGFAAAGIAFALQNVILSMASYFFLGGRFGIRVGDRVEIQGVRGDVIDITLLKFTMLELAGDGHERQPTGRVVVFPNSVVFQSTTPCLFKQTPGTSFVWNELRLTLAPDCDYRLAEKKLFDVVDQVFARYREAIQREYRELERHLNLHMDSPRPQSRLRLSTAGIELALRYPAEARHAASVSDEVSRRVLDAIKRDPILSLAVQGTPNIRVLEPAGAVADGASAGAARGSAPATAAPDVTKAGS